MEVQAQFQLQHAITIQDQFWREKSRVQKFKDGNRNTSYFHRIARIKASSKDIHMSRHNNQYFNIPESIEDHVVNYNKAIFATPNECRV